MRPTPRLAMISASIGAGHDQAADQLTTALVAYGCTVNRHDFLDLLPAGAGHRFSHLYAAQLRRAPGSWGALVGTLRRPSLAGVAAGAIARAAAPGLQAALTGQEDLVVSTFPLASQALGRLRATGQLASPVATFLCDPSVHPLWVSDGVDTHMAVDTVAAAQAHRLGARGIVVCAPAVGAQFRPGTEAEKRAARARWGLPDGPIALVVGGSWGAGQLAHTARDIAATGLATPVTVCGRNTRLHRRLVGGGPGITLGWVADMAELLRAADVVVHNAGGMTCWEAIAVGVPLLAYRALPGHGTANAAALKQAGLSAWCRDRAQLQAALRDPRPVPPRPVTAPRPADALAWLLGAQFADLAPTT
jgi:UDP-N-acetylglucosamine:LPS N-acetylglucosamine transferase